MSVVMHIHLNCYGDRNKIVDHFRSIKEESTSLSFSYGDFSSRRGELFTAFSQLPPQVLHLNFKGLRLNAAYEKRLWFFDLFQLKQWYKVYLSFFFRPEKSIFSMLIQTIEVNYQTLLLDSNDLALLSIDELIDTFRSFRSSLKTLSLANNQLGSLPTADVIQLMLALPTTIQYLDISNNQFEMKTINEIKSIIEALPKSIKTLKLSDTHSLDFINHSADDIITLLNHLPSNIKRLKFGSPFSTKSTADIINILNNLPASIDCSDMFNDLNFENRNITDYCRLIENAPTSLTKLNLNQVKEHSTNEIISILESVPHHINEISIPGLINRYHLILGSLPAHIKKVSILSHLSTLDACTKKLFSFPAHITTLNLCDIDLGNGLTSTNQYVSLHTLTKRLHALNTNLSTLPKTITSIDLSNNGLFSITKMKYCSPPEGFTYAMVQKNWQEFLNSIPPTVNTLTLAGNNIDYRTHDKIRLFFSYIPTHITCIDLNTENLEHINAKDLISFITSLPEHIKTINLSNTNLFKHKNSAEIDGILSSLNKLQRVILLEKNGEPDIARALAPLVSANKANRLNTDVTFLIMSYLLPQSIKADFFIKIMNSMIEKIPKLPQESYFLTFFSQPRIFQALVPNKQDENARPNNLL